MAILRRIGKKSFSDDRALIDAIHQNNPNVWDHFYKEVYPFVQGIIMQHGGREADARDVFQEALIALWSNIREGHYTKRADVKLSSYLIRICKYRWYETTKSASYRREGELPVQFDRAEQENIDQTIAIAERKEVLKKLLAKIGEHCRELLFAFYFREMSLKTIANSFEITEASAKNGKYRCMEKLRQEAENIGLTEDVF